MKMDIAKAFDSISWEYLIEVLTAVGFTWKWQDWISLLLSTASSSFLLNRVVGPPIIHRKGLRE